MSNNAIFSNFVKSYLNSIFLRLNNKSNLNFPDFEIEIEEFFEYDSLSTKNEKICFDLFLVKETSKILIERWNFENLEK